MKRRSFLRRLALGLLAGPVALLALASRKPKPKYDRITLKGGRIRRSSPGRDTLVPHWSEEAAKRYVDYMMGEKRGGA